MINSFYVASTVNRLLERGSKNLKENSNAYDSYGMSNGRWYNDLLDGTSNSQDGVYPVLKSPS
jgi:hypothetical protein